MTDNLAEEDKNSKPGVLNRIRHGLEKTRSHLTDGLSHLLLSKKEIDEDLLEEVETLLLTADVGINATEEIISNLTARVRRKELSDSEALYTCLKQLLTEILTPCEQPLNMGICESPYVILIVGVNGAGKTTTIGKLASLYKQKGLDVMLAAGDTYRAAAVEQLKTWGERIEVPVIAQPTGSDSASVIFDALLSAKAKKADVLIADTAGRLQNKVNLMQELQKIGRVMEKGDAQAPHEVMLVIDAGTGQNALQQARMFQECVNVTGIVLTKLDGTGKGGIIFSIARQLQIPIRFIGVGEQLEDLQPFSASRFVEALFGS